MLKVSIVVGPVLGSALPGSSMKLFCSVPLPTVPLYPLDGSAIIGIVLLDRLVAVYPVIRCVVPVPLAYVYVRHLLELATLIWVLVHCSLVIAMRIALVYYVLMDGVLVPTHSSAVQ